MDLAVYHLLKIRHADLPFFADLERRNFSNLAPLAYGLLRDAEKLRKLFRIVDRFLFPRHTVIIPHPARAGAGWVGLVFSPTIDYPRGRKKEVSPVIRFFSTTKELRGIESRMRRGWIKEPVEMRPVCSKCHLEKVGLLSNDSPIRGVVVDNKIYCREHAFAHLRAEHPELNEAEFEKHLLQYKSEGVAVQQFYVYSPQNHNQPA